MLTINSVIQWPAEEAKDIRWERILWFNEDEIITIDILDTKILPVIRSTAEVEVMIADEEAQITTVTNGCVEKKLSPKADQQWKLACNAVNWLVKNVPAIYYPEQRGPLIAEAMIQFGLTKPALYKYLRRYWQGGMLKSALYPTFDLCGKRKEGERVITQKQGRPHTRTIVKPEAVGLNLNEEILKKFNLGKKLFLKGGRTKKSLRKAFGEMLRKFFNEGYRLEHKVLVPIMPSPENLPSYWQFKYWLEKQKDLDLSAILIGLYGEKEYQKTYRPITGNSTREAAGPGAKYQVDAHIVDVHLVSRYDRSLLIGRPVLYFLIDVYSRMIVGMYIGLEGPSWLAAMQALANAALDKVEYCKGYGIDISPEEWPCKGLPEVILADRGEFIGYGPENLIDALGVDIENTAPYRADMKGIIERHFRLSKEKYIAWVPGAIIKEHRERGEPDYRLGAALDLDEFTQIIIYCVLEHNNSYRMPWYPMDAQAIEANVEPYPIQLWNFGIRKKTGRMRNYSKEMILGNLLPSEQNVSMSRKGIKFHKSLYLPKMEDAQQWLTTMRSLKKSSLQISYDPRNMSQILLRLDGGKKFEICYRVSGEEERFSHWSYEELELYHEQQKIGNALAEGPSIQSSASLGAKIDKVVADARKKTEDVLKSKGDGKGIEVKNSRITRAVEKKMGRDDKAWHFGDQSKALLAAGNEDSPNIDSKTNYIGVNRREDILKNLK